MFNTTLNKVNYLLILFLGIILFIPFLGTTHLFDWDEINFAESSREMIISNSYLIPKINFEAFWEKPPLFFWFQVMAMKVLGINEFASRFPNAIAGIITLLMFYTIGKNKVDKSFGLLWVLVYTASLLPHLYFKSGIIDPWFNLFIFSSIYYLSTHLEQIENKSRFLHLILAGIFSGLAMLTKGPVGILIVGLTVCFYFLLNFKKVGFKLISDYFIYLFFALLIGSIWFLALYLNGDKEIIKEFIVYQIRLFQTEDADHGGPFYYHFIVLLIGCFPTSVLAILAMTKNNNLEKNKSNNSILYFKSWMTILFWVGLILFSIVKTKIVHYSSICYFPLSYLATITTYNLYKNKFKLPNWAFYFQIIIGFALSFALIIVTFIESIKPYLLKNNLIEDEFTLESLKAIVKWNGLEWISGFILLIGVIFYLYNSKKEAFKSLIVLMTTCVVCFNLAIILITPNVEPYSQGATIEFFKTIKNKNAVIEPLGFKSYGQYFYSERPEKFKGYSSEKILSKKIITKDPVYFVAKIHRAKELENQYPEIKKLYQKNGFVFYQYIPFKN
ncbi:MAG: ArnT family glycosyltransferase [Solirubrobacteraceae bacterium]